MHLPIAARGDGVAGLDALALVGHSQLALRTGHADVALDEADLSCRPSELQRHTGAHGEQEFGETRLEFHGVLGSD